MPGMKTFGKFSLSECKPTRSSGNLIKHFSIIYVVSVDEVNYHKVRKKCMLDKRDH